MNLSPKAVKLLEDFLNARKAIKAKEPSVDKAWAATYGPNGLWESCVEDIAAFGGTREQAIQYVYTERQRGRAV